MSYLQRLNADNERARERLKAAHARTQALQEQLRAREEEIAWLMLERQGLLAEMGIKPEGEGRDGD